MPDPTKPVTLDLQDLAVNERGELHIANPELVTKLKQSIADSVRPGAAAADNYVGCGGNAYQCGKSGASGMDELINVARNAKLAKTGG
ncbi:hypothetical protein [Paracidovorax anthurii]|uniref:Uncharacterized protein n=1 Tax=Paracidovorax anthurii TaxID=78229 RepID=A0A328YVX9_9BURK|nr:hypothetical protein [Paracidovorax anthurii]RAR76352.1 hypothetical protein AX018_10492 [Paracidovorax anthurii]